MMSPRQPPRWRRMWMPTPVPPRRRWCRSHRQIRCLSIRFRKFAKQPSKMGWRPLRLNPRKCGTGRISPAQWECLAKRRAWLRRKPGKVRPRKGGRARAGAQGIQRRCPRRRDRHRPGHHDVRAGLAPGMKVSAITALTNDIMRALKAESVRIVAPVPGKTRSASKCPTRRRKKSASRN
jgi:hypothetical protein